MVPGIHLLCKFVPLISYGSSSVFHLEWTSESHYRPLDHHWVSESAPFQNVHYKNLIWSIRPVLNDYLVVSKSAPVYAWKMEIPADSAKIELLLRSALGSFKVDHVVHFSECALFRTVFLLGPLLISNGRHNFTVSHEKTADSRNPDRSREYSTKIDFESETTTTLQSGGLGIRFSVCIKNGQIKSTLGNENFASQCICHPSSIFPPISILRFTVHGL